MSEELPPLLVPSNSSNRLQSSSAAVGKPSAMMNRPQSPTTRLRVLAHQSVQDLVSTAHQGHDLHQGIGKDKGKGYGSNVDDIDPSPCPPLERSTPSKSQGPLRPPATAGTIASNTSTITSTTTVVSDRKPGKTRIVTEVSNDDIQPAPAPELSPPRSRPNNQRGGQQTDQHPLHNRDQTDQRREKKVKVVESVQVRSSHESPLLESVNAASRNPRGLADERSAQVHLLSPVQIKDFHRSGELEHVNVKKQSYKRVLPITPTTTSSSPLLDPISQRSPNLKPQSRLSVDVSDIGISMYDEMFTADRAADYAEDVIQRLGPEERDPRKALAQVIDVIKENEFEALGVLLSRASTISVINNLDEYDEYSPLVWAAKLGHDECVERLCSHSEVEINRPAGWNKNSALLMAAERNRVSTVALLLRYKANINFKNQVSMTALMIAAELGLHDVLMTLLEHRADCKLVDKDRYTALILAAWNSNSFAVEQLCLYDNSKEHLEMRNIFGKTAFFLSAEKDDLKSLQILHRHGCDTNAMSNRNLSPLMLVCVLGNKNVFDFLVNPPENPVASLTLKTQVDKIGKDHTVMTYACSQAKCSIDMLKLLINRYFNDTQFQCIETICTALSGACSGGHVHSVEIVKMLLAGVKTASPSLLRYQDPVTHNTFVMFACQNGNIDLLHELLQYIKQASVSGLPDKDHYRFHLKAKNKGGKTALMILADYFTNNDVKMIEYLKKAASTNPARPYLLDMFPHLLKNCKSPQTVMNKCKDDVVMALRSQKGPEADVQLVGALVNIAVALKQAATTNSIEARELLAQADEFEEALLELMNCSSMDDTENVTKVLRRRCEETEELSDHILKAISVCEGPLYLCVKHELTQILSTAQIATFVQNVFYSSLKVRSDLPIRTIADLFRLRTGATINRFKPYTMFCMECLVMPMFLLIPVTLCAMAKSKESCYDELSASRIPATASICPHYDNLVRFLVLMLFSRIMYEAGELRSRLNKIAGQTLFETIICYASGIYSHICFDIWNFLDFVTICCLSFWVLDGYQAPACLAWATITICMSILRFLSLSKQIGQLTIMIFAMCTDLLPFVSIFFTSMVGFGFGFHHKFSDIDEFNSIGSTVLALFNAAMGSYDFDIFHGDAVGIGMMVVYLVVVNIVLLNLVVARMSATHEKIDMRALEVWSRGQAVNTKEFTLLHDRNPMCMVPAPFNICTTIIYVLFDWFLPKFSGGKKPVLIDKSDKFELAGQHRHAMEPTDHYHHEYSARIISRVGTFSDKIISILAAPVDAVQEVFLAIQQLKGPFKSNAEWLAFLLFPVWVIVFFLLIVVATIAEDPTYLRDEVSARVIFDNQPNAAYKPALIQLCWIIIFSAAAVVGSLNYFQPLDIYFSMTWADIDWQSWQALDIGIFCYHTIVMDLTMLVLLFVLTTRLSENWKLQSYVDQVKRNEVLPTEKLTEMWRLLDSRIRNCISAVAGLNIFVLVALKRYFLPRFLSIYMLECAELLLTGVILTAFCSNANPAKAETVTSHYSCRKGKTCKKDKPAEHGTLDINIIRGNFPTCGHTIFGTSRNPFVVVSYPHANSKDYGIEDIQYTKTIETDAKQSSFFDFVSFDIRTSDLIIHIDVYDRESDNIIKYLCGAQCDIREWIANRRYEAQIPMLDTFSRQVPDTIQVACKVRFPQSTSQKTPLIRRGSNNMAALRSGSLTPSSRVDRNVAMTRRGSDTSSDTSPRSKGSTSGMQPLFPPEDRDRIFDKLMNKSERNMLLQVLQMQRDVRDELQSRGSGTNYPSDFLTPASSTSCDPRS